MEDKTALSYWFPRLEAAGLPVPKTIVMNPQLKVLLIRNGSLLDEDNLALMGQMAADAGAQVWMERVGEGSECSVIIEDGQVKQGALL